MDGSLVKLGGFTSVIIFAVILARPGTAQQCVTISPPDDAIVLFEGTDTLQWVTMNGDPCAWTVEDGVMVAREQNIMTKQEFGDHQLHVEFHVPVREDPNDKLSGNSGVYVHGDYEIQVIDSHGIEPDAGVCCGAIYGQAAPLVNASLPAGEWQSFDVYFHAPRFDGEGKLVEKARMSVVHNGIWIHDDRECDMTPGGLAGNLKTTGPLLLQYHGYPVRYRNIWVRPLVSNVEQ